MRIVNFTNSQSTTDGANPVLNLDTGADASSDVLIPPITGEVRTGLVTVQNITAGAVANVKVEGSFGTTHSLAHITFADAVVANYDEEVVTIIDVNGTCTFTFDKDITAVARSAPNTYVVPAITDTATAASLMKDAINLAKDTHGETSAQCFTSTRGEGSADLEIVGMDSSGGVALNVNITTTGSDMALEEHYGGEELFQTIHTFTSISANSIDSAVVTLFPKMRITSGTDDNDGYVVATLMV